MTFSIITINYNNVEGLKRTFDSVFNQSFQDFEYIVIDGSSTDSSKEYIKENQSKIDFWISEPDKGVFHAMNKGVQNSKGRYLIFMNSGDAFYEKSTLEKINQNLNGHMIYYGNSFENTQKKLLKFPEKLSFSFFQKTTLAHQATITKREVFEKYMLFNEGYKVSGDWAFFIQMICKHNASHKYLNFTICLYEGGGLSTEYDDEIKKERKEVYDQNFVAYLDDYNYYNESKHFHSKLKKTGLLYILRKIGFLKYI